MTPGRFVSELASFDLPAVFNPWNDQCPDFDTNGAASLRRQNLQRVLEAALEAGVETIWIARDLGYRGGRRTGLPLTDEVHLGAAGELFGGVSLDRATKGPPVAERTAAVVWRVLQTIGKPVVLWNVFPFHPHLPGDPQSNRCHTRVERQVTWPILQALIGMIQPKGIVAIGRDAHTAMARLGIPSLPVRHPSYGGQGDFIAGLAAIYGFTDDFADGDGRLPLDPLQAASEISATA
jgi:uracil-DNA glycosylase